MGHRHARFRPFLLDLTGNLFHLGRGHLGVGLVFEMRDRAAARGLADHARERADRAGALMCDSSLHPARIQRPRSELKEDTGAVSTSAHWRDKGDLIAVSDLRVPIGELLVERDTDSALVGLQPGM